MTAVVPGHKTWAYDVVSDSIVIVDADGTFRLYQL